MAERWQGIIAVEGEPTGDGRMIERGAIRFDNLPVALIWDREEGDHTGMVIGFCDEVWRDGDYLMGAGEFSESQDESTQAAVARAIELLREGAVGVSVALDDESRELRIDPSVLEDIEIVDDPEDPENSDGDEEEETDADGRVIVARMSSSDYLDVTTDGRLRHVAIVDTAAFINARIALEGDPAAEEEDEEDLAVVACFHHPHQNIGLVASLDLDRFTNPNFGRDDTEDARLVRQEPERTGETVAYGAPLTVTDDGHVFGHAALWGRCHAGYTNRCVTPPRAESYARFLSGAAVPGVATGPLTVGTWHPDLGIPAAETMQHYSDTGRAVADIVVGEDRHGIWVTGQLRPGATDEDIAALRGSTLSGDWRPIGNRLVLCGMLAVNNPGFLVQRAEEAALAASFISVGPTCHECGTYDAADAAANGSVAVLLAPSEEDAARLAVEGGDPASSLHVTLAWVGEADDVDEEEREELMVRVSDLASEMSVITAEAWGHAVFNANSSERQPATVLLLGSEQLNEARGQLEGHDRSSFPNWIPHLTLGYELEMPTEQLAERCGPVSLNRLLVAFGEEVYEFVLGEEVEIDDQNSSLAADDEVNRLRARVELLEVLAGEFLVRDLKSSGDSHGA